MSQQAERQLILLSAGTAERRSAAQEQAQLLLSDVDWPQLAEALRVRKLLTVLGPRIEQLSDGRAGDSFALAVEQALEAGRRQGTLIQLVCLRVMAMLAEAGIRSSALKGPMLGEAIYGDPGRRISSDIDLLVSPDQLQAATDVVRSLGYRAPAGYVRRDGLPLLHFMLAHDEGRLPPIELHWRVHWYERSFARERLLPPSHASSGQWRPDPPDELLALLLFYARDGFVDLRLAADLSAWWDAYGAELEAGALDRALCPYPALSRAVIAAAMAAEAVVGLPAAQLLGERGRPRLRERVAMRLANPNPHTSLSQLYAEIGLIDGLLAPSGGLRAFVRRQLLPPPEVLDEQARHGERRRPRSPFVRCIGMLGRYLLAMTRLLRAGTARL